MIERKIEIISNMGSKGLLTTLLLAFIVSMTLIPVKVISTNQDVVESEVDLTEGFGFLDKMVVRYYESGDAMLQGLYNGEIDVVEGYYTPQYSINLTEVEKQGLNPNLHPHDRVGVAIFNTQRFPTNIRALRQAFAYAVDKENIIKNVFSDLGNPKDDLLPTNHFLSCEYNYQKTCGERGSTYYKPNLNQAHEELVKVGFYDYDGDGMKEFFNSTVVDGNQILWNATSIVSGGGDPLWNGYHYGGYSFSEVNVLGGGDSLLLPSISGTDALRTELKNSSCWVELAPLIIPSFKTNSLLDSPPLHLNETFHLMGLPSVILSFEGGSGILGYFDTFNTGNYSVSLGSGWNYFFYSDAGGLLVDFLGTNYHHLTKNLYQKPDAFENQTYNAALEMLDKLASSELPKIIYNSSALREIQNILWHEQPYVPLYQLLIARPFDESTTITITELNEPNINGAEEYDVWELLLAKNRSATTTFSGVLYIGSKTEPMSPNNLLKGTMSEQIFSVTTNLLFDPLFRISPDEKELIPFLAKNYEFKRDGVVVSLNSNVTWHDGSLLTVDDVVNSYNQLKNSSVKNYLPSYDVVKINESSLRITLEEVNHNNLQTLTFPVFSSDFWDKQGLETESTSLIGSGAYKWSELSSSSNTILVRNENYYKRPGNENNPSQSSSLLSSETTEASSVLFAPLLLYITIIKVKKRRF